VSRHDQLVASIEARVAKRKAARAKAARRKANQAAARRKRAATGYTRREATKRGNRLRALAPRLDPHLRAIYDHAPATIKRLILEQVMDDRSPFVRNGPDLEEVLKWKTA